MSLARAQLTASVDLINAFATLGEVNEASSAAYSALAEADRTGDLSRIDAALDHIKLAREALDQARFLARRAKALAINPEAVA